MIDLINPDFNSQTAYESPSELWSRFVDYVHAETELASQRVAKTTTQKKDTTGHQEAQEKKSQKRVLPYLSIKKFEMFAGIDSFDDFKKANQSQEWSRCFALIYKYIHENNLEAISVGDCKSM